MATLEEIMQKHNIPVKQKPQPTNAGFKLLDQASLSQPLPKYVPPSEGLGSKAKRVAGVGLTGLGVGALDLIGKGNRLLMPTLPLGEALLKKATGIDAQEEWKKGLQLLSEKGRELSGARGTLGEEIAYGIGKETPAILASYGAVGAASKVPQAARLLTGAGKWTETGRRGVAAGAIYTPIAKDDPTARDYLENMALFGVGDVAAMGLAHGVGKGINALRGRRVNLEEPGNIDYLPAERSASYDYLVDMEPASTAEYAPWVQEDLINDFNLRRRQEIQQALTEPRDVFAEWRENQFMQPWPDYIPPQGLEANFTVDPLGNAVKGRPLQALPSGTKPLALPPGRQPLALTGKEPKMLNPGQNWEFGTGYPKEGHWFADPFGVVRGTPETALALPEGLPTSPALRLGGKKGQLKYPSAKQLEGAMPDHVRRNAQHVKALEGKYKKIVNDEIASMKDEIGGVIRYRPGEGAPLLRASMNPKWYRDFYASNGRAPRAGEMRDMAIERLIRGNPETGEPPSEEFLGILSELSRGRKMPEEWHGLTRSMREMEATGEPELRPLIGEMSRRRAGLEPSGLNRNLGKLTDMENSIRRRTRMADEADFGQYRNVRFKAQANHINAARKFGTTDDFREAGYLTPTGKLLDFSGKRQGGPRGQRTMDHREIHAIYEENFDGYSDAMIKFMNEGNIRMQSYGFEVSNPPTKEQERVLVNFINKNDGEVVVDLNKIGEAEGTPISAEYPAGTKATKIIADIRKFYATGEEPHISEISQFRYKQNQDLAILQEAMTKRVGPLRIGKVDLAPEAFTKPDFKAAQAIADKLGLRLVAFKGTGHRGMQQGRTIYLNQNMKDPLDYVFWHEVGHTMEVTHPQHYDSLMGIALEHMQDADGLLKHYKDFGYAMEDMPHEFAADVFAEALHTPGFFARVAEKSPEILKPLLEAIDSLIANIKAMVSKDDTVLPYLKDLEKLRERIHKEVAEPYFRDAMGEKEFVDTFGQKWTAAKAKGGRIEPASTDTPEFRNWFGDSKVVDESGKPIKVYHGTSNGGFTEFDPQKIPKEGNYFGKGFYFTNKKNVAKTYETKGNGETPQTLTTYLSLKNPLDIDANGEAISREFINYLKENNERVSDGMDWWFTDEARKAKGKNYNQFLTSVAAAQNEGLFQTFLRNKGYDGITHIGGKLSGGPKHQVYVAFSPTQIKSIYNRGTWDPTNPDIRYKLNQTSPMDDLKSMVEYGAANLRGGRASFEKAIRQQFGKQLEGYSPEVINRLLNDIWHDARDLQQKGETVLKFQGQEIPLKRGEVAQPTAKAATTGEGGLLEGLDINPSELRDISGRQAGWRDIWRNMRDTFGDKFPEIEKRILYPLEDAKAAWVDHQRALTDDLYTNVVDELGIKKGSRESELVQLYGEGGYRHWESAPKSEQSRQRWLANLERKYGRQNVEFTGDGAYVNESFDYNDLVNEVGAERAADIVQAENWFRQKYDELLDQVNAVRAQIYPGQQDKLVPKRQDYFHHFREMEGVEGIMNLFDTSAQISPELAGKSMYTRPKTKFAGFMQQRGMGKYKPDAVGGFLEYVPSATYAIHIDPQGAAFRQLENELVKTMDGNTGINKFLEYLKYYADDIQGKTNFFDRNWQFLTSREFFTGLVTLNNRIKGNMVLGNAGTMVSQVFNMPQGIAFAKQYSAPGLTRYLSSLIKRMADPEGFAATNPMAESRFLKERFSGDMYRRFATKPGEKAKNVAVIGMEDVDRFATEFIWSAAYEKALHTKGITDPVRYADYHARRLVAGRGVGEVPLMQKSKIVQLVAPFQVEVGNLLNVIGDMRVDKDWIGAFVALPLTLWLFNRGSEAVKGMPVALDPIEAVREAIQIARDDTKDDKALRIFGRLAGELLGNMPLGQTVAALYPEYGFKAGDKQLPTRKEFFGREDPTRYGSGLLIARAIQDPLYKAVFPWGGAQAKKTVQGIDALRKGGSYTNKDQLRYPISTDPVNALKGVVFGPSGFRETDPYYEADRRPLSEKQTEKVQKSRSPKEAYEGIHRTRKINALKQQIKDIAEDKKLSPEEKKKKTAILKLELQRVKAGY